jgi:7-cyano-7-deazaguanine synthase
MRSIDSPDRRLDVSVLASGGLDSCILVSNLLSQGLVVWPIYVQSGLVWQADELRYLRRYLQRIRGPSLRDLVLLELPLADLYDGHWSVTGDSAPGESTPDDAVYLPGRNILLTIKPALWCEQRGIGELALATLQSNPFDDASDEFFQAYQAALERGGAKTVKIVRPFGTLEKRNVMQLGRDCPLEETFSCIAPVGGLHCGRCNKCAERKAAFACAEMRDPTRYAN